MHVSILCHIQSGSCEWQNRIRWLLCAELVDQRHPSLKLVPRCITIGKVLFPDGNAPGYEARGTPVIITSKTICDVTHVHM